MRIRWLHALGFVLVTTLLPTKCGRSGDFVFPRQQWPPSATGPLCPAHHQHTKKKKKAILPRPRKQNHLCRTTASAVGQTHPIPIPEISGHLLSARHVPRSRSPDPARPTGKQRGFRPLPA